LLGNTRLIGFLRKVSSPYNVNGVALTVLPEALADTEYLNWYITQVHEGRERVFAALREFGVRTWPSAANFVLMDIGARHKELCARMRERGVLLRDRSSDPGCEGYVRFTVGVEEHVTRGIEALRDVLREMQWTRAESRPAAATSDQEREFE
jgi:histidinol-phosphate aminotransferase